MSKSKKILKIIAIVLCIVLIAVMIPFSVIIIKPSVDFKKGIENLKLTPVSESAQGTDKIHLLRTGPSDAIVLESNGHLAMIDAGEDTDNPRGFENLELDGYEEKVLAYLKDNFADENGKVHLDFVLGTHSHSDHLGGFDTVISDPDIEIEKAYLKVYNSSKIKDMEVEQYDNQEVYDQMVNALNEKNVPIISDIDDKPFRFGNFTITFFNTKDPESKKKVGENDQSLGVLVEKNGTRAFLAGDIDNFSGDESRLAESIGDVDLLKVGHHSNEMSSTGKYIRTLDPETCVVTNNFEGIHELTLYYIIYICHPQFLITGRENGVVAEIGDNGQINYYNNIH